MPTSVNEITGDRIVSKHSDTYQDNWELVFGKKYDMLKDTTEKPIDNSSNEEENEA